MTNSNLISVKRAATILKVTRVSVYKAIQRGVLERVYIDGKPFITIESLDAYRESRKKK